MRVTQPNRRPSNTLEWVASPSEQMSSQVKAARQQELNELMSNRETYSAVLVPDQSSPSKERIERDRDLHSIRQGLKQQNSFEERMEEERGHQQAIAQQQLAAKREERQLVRQQSSEARKLWQERERKSSIDVGMSERRPSQSNSFPRSPASNVQHHHAGANFSFESNSNGNSSNNVASVNPSQIPLSTGVTVKALYEYDATDDSEITLRIDDVIVSVEQLDPGWWRGIAPDGSHGLFPANYVEVI